MKRGAIGRLLRNVRAGHQKLLGSHPSVAAVPAILKVTSPAFADGGAIPLAHAGPGVGENQSPPLDIAGVPNDAAELLITFEDPDAPVPRPWLHLTAFGIAPSRTHIAGGGLNAPASGVDFGQGAGRHLGYSGPRAIPGHGPHHYHFNVYALRRPSGLTTGASRAAVQKVLANDAIARGRLVGVFERT